MTINSICVAGAALACSLLGHYYWGWTGPDHCNFLVAYFVTLVLALLVANILGEL